MPGSSELKVWMPILIAALLGVLAGMLAGWFARDFFAVEACLDAGGLWKAPGYCVGVRAE